jgi:1-phosphofructokinase
MTATAAGGSVCVFAPAPLLTVTIDVRSDGGEDLHVHPGGQGVWVARMLGVLGATATLCAPLGGETGNVLRGLLRDEAIDLRAVDTPEATGAYVHDRRTGERRELWRAPLRPLGRHTVDDLFSETMAAALDAGVCVLTGTDRRRSVLPDSTYTRLARDLRANRVIVVCDLQGELLRASLEGGVDLVKISQDELLEDGWAEGPDSESLEAGIRALQRAGATDVVVSRASGGALATVDGALFTVRAPAMTVVDPTGAGDSMTAALALGRSQGRSSPDTLRLAAAAGAVNVTRHGLGSGEQEAITRLAENVEIARVQVGLA